MGTCPTLSYQAHHLQLSSSTDRDGDRPEAAVHWLGCQELRLLHGDHGGPTGRSLGWGGGTGCIGQSTGHTVLPQLLPARSRCCGALEAE
jgi:hypothetical protein